jgi:formiminoglutamase
MNLTSAVYQTPASIQLSGRQDDPAGRFFQILKPWDINQAAPIEQGIVLLGFACDLGVARNLGRIGAAQGPLACIQQLARLPVHTKFPIYWAGILSVQHQLDAAQQDLAMVVKKIHEAGHTPLVIGGGHETAWGHYLGLTRCHELSQFGIVNVDAHLDLRPLPADGIGHSGTPFLQMANHRQSKQQPFFYHCWGVQQIANTRALFETSKRLSVSTLLASEIVSNPEKLRDAVRSVVNTYEALYLSICLDVFSSAHAPGVSAPSPLGLLPHQVLPAIHQLVRSGKVRAIDLVELAPSLDHTEQTTKLAASLLAEVIYHYVPSK